MTIASASGIEPCTTTGTDSEFFKTQISDVCLGSYAILLHGMPHTQKLSTKNYKKNCSKKR